MILAFRRPCADHRPALLAWVDRRELGPATPAALDHLDRCRRCESELADVAVAATVLRRIGDELAALEPPPDAWLRLRARLAPATDPWRWRTSLGGLLTSAMIAAVLVLPVSFGAPAALDNGGEIPGTPAEFRVESEYLASIRAGTLPPAPRVALFGGSLPHVYPPEIAQVRKEVTWAPPPMRPAEPI